MWPFQSIACGVTLQDKHAPGRSTKPPNLLFRALVTLHLSELWWHWFWTGAEVGVRCELPQLVRFCTAAARHSASAHAC